MVGPRQAGQAGQETTPQTEPEALGESSLRSIDSRMLLNISLYSFKTASAIASVSAFHSGESGRAKQAQQF